MSDNRLKNINRRQIVIKAINHEQTEIIPYQMAFSKDTASRLRKKFKNPRWEATVGNFFASTGDGKDKMLAGNRRQDHFGVIWRMDQKGDFGVVDNCLIEAPNLKSYSFPEPDEKLIRSRCKKLVGKRNKDLFKMFSIGFSLFERAWTLRGGIENIMKDFVRYPDFTLALFDKICEYNLGVLDIALKFSDKMDAVYFGDDWGMQRGTLMGLKHWRKFIKPSLSRMYKRVKDEGLYVCQHSCGDIYTLFPDLVEIGLDIYNTFQPEVYDIEKVKAEFGDRLTFYGGISTQTLLPFGTPEEVKKEVKRMMEIMGKNGGYVVAPTHAITNDIPTENILAFLEVVQNQ
ncbi:MAG: uroporphyrinogen decarboxylase family protein [Candidatus Hodarchaeota archaeon]